MPTEGHPVVGSHLVGCAVACGEAGQCCGGGCLGSPAVAHFGRVFLCSGGVVVGVVVFHRVGTPVACAEGEECEAFPVEREVQAEHEGRAVPAGFAQVHLVFAIDDFVAVLVHVLDVAGLCFAAEGALVVPAFDFILVLEDACALVAPQAVDGTSFAVLVGVLGKKQ